MKPFNLELAKQGHPVCTRDGRPARIVCFDREGNKYDKPYPILALVKDEEYEEVVAYCSDGTQVTGETKYDLFMASEKKTGWINIYLNKEGKIYPGTIIRDSKKEVFEMAGNMANYVDTIKIEVEV